MRLKPLNFLAITIAGIINAIGVCMFMAPVGLYDGGISGTSMLLSNLTPLSLSIFLVILNIPLFLFGFKSQGGIFTIYSLYSVCVYSAASYIINTYFIYGNYSPFVGNDLLLCAIFGGILSGIGSGLVIRFGGAIDGIEVMSVIFAKRLGLTVGTFVMIYNTIIYLIAAIIMHTWVLPLYSILTYMATLKTVDFVVEGFDKAKSAIIITSEGDKICKVLSEEFGSGITIVEAKDFYSGTDKKMIYFVVNRFQIGKLRNLVHDLDENAYISITEVSDVFGSGSKR